MSNFYKIITAIFFILSILTGAYWEHMNNSININIDNSKKYITTPSVQK